MVSIPQVDIEKMHGAVTQIASNSPSKKMFEILLKSVDLTMDNIIEARESLSGTSPAVDAALKKWDKAFEEFGIREAWYANALDTSEDPDDIKERLANPLLRGRFPAGTPHPPTWPDLETPWRLMNDIATVGAMAHKPQSFFDNLEDLWRSNFSSYWKTNALRLAMHAKKLERGGDEGAEMEAAMVSGVSFSSTPFEDARAYRDAAESSASFAQKTDEFFSRENWEKIKKGAKHVGIGMAVGVALTILLVVRVRA
jgi:hypothetical protein